MQLKYEIKNKERSNQYYKKQCYEYYWKTFFMYSYWMIITLLP